MSGMTTAAPPVTYVSTAAEGRDGFRSTVRAEWTKLRTVRGWMAGLVIAGLLTVLLGLIDATSGGVRCGSGSAPPGETGGRAEAGGNGAVEGTRCDSGGPPTGPTGETVTDRSYLVHQRLVGNGAITARVTGLVGRGPSAGTTEPWAKAGVIVRGSTRQGATYAAVLVTGGHGVRMQHDFVNDIAGPAGTVSATTPRWLRLVRDGDLLTGYASTDGTEWTKLGVAELDGLPDAAEVGLFVASPDHEETELGFLSGSTVGGPSLAEATIDDVVLSEGWHGDAWRGTAIQPDGPRVDGPAGPAGPGPADVGAPTPPAAMQGLVRRGDTFTVTGTGDLAPSVGPGPSGGIEQSLVGLFAGLVAAIVVGVLFGSAEYRRGLIRTTFTAAPRRGRVLLAKAAVLGTATFGVGLVATACTLWLVVGLRRDRGRFILPVGTATEMRVVVGVALLLALGAVLGLAAGVILRRGGGAVTLTVALVVLPYLMAVASAVPLSAANWLLRVTPAAGFAVQQTVEPYPQVAGNYTPPAGFFPLPWWGGFGVLVLWTTAALALAVVLVRRRDA